MAFSIGVYALPSRWTEPARLSFVRIFHPLLRIGPAAKGASPAAPADQQALQAEYNRLWADYQNAQARLDALLEQYQRLAEFRSRIPGLTGGVVLANAMDKPTAVNATFHIDKGADDGIAAGCFVVSAEQRSLIGVIDQTGRQIARVRLLTDAGVSLEARIRQRSGSELSAMLVGTGKQRCQISMIDRQQDVREGDAVFAAPKKGLLNAPIVVGRISQVKPDPDWPLLWKITVEPVEDAAQLTQVAVLVGETLPKGR